MNVNGKAAAKGARECEDAREEESVGTGNKKLRASTLTAIIDVGERGRYGRVVETM